MTTYRDMQGATTSNVAASASAVQVLAQNPSRKSAVFYNDSSVNCYLKIEAINTVSPSASTTSFSYKMPPNYTVELMTDPIVNSMISAIWDSATGNMRVTEIM